MANYKSTNTPGESRRRAYKISIYNPADTSKDVGGVPRQTLRVIFEMEDKINMADGSSILVPVGDMTVLLDELTLAQNYAAVDIVTGEVDPEDTRTGYEIMMTIIDGLEDVFVNEGMKRDALLEYVPPMDPPTEDPEIEDPVDPPIEDPIDPIDPPTEDPVDPPIDELPPVEDPVDPPVEEIPDETEDPMDPPIEDPVDPELPDEPSEPEIPVE